MIPFVKTCPESSVIDIQNAYEEEPIAFTIDVKPQRMYDYEPTPQNSNPIRYWNSVNAYVSDVYDVVGATVYNINITEVKHSQYT